MISRKRKAQLQASSLQLMFRVLTESNGYFYFNVAETCNKFHMWEQWISWETIKEQMQNISFFFMEERKL